MRGSNKMKRGGTEWHLEQEDNDSKYEGEGSSGYDWRDPNRIKIIDCDMAFDTLDVDDKDLYMYMYTMEGEHYFKHRLTRDYLKTEEVPDE
jgi:hypothetical protein